MTSLVHVAVFWLKKSAPPDLRARMIDLYRRRLRAEVPGVLGVWAGAPRRADREVVDDTFTLLSVVRFADAEAELGWQRHSLHDELRRMFEGHLDRVVVYDMMD